MRFLSLLAACSAVKAATLFAVGGTFFKIDAMKADVDIGCERCWIRFRFRHHCTQVPAFS